MARTAWFALAASAAAGVATAAPAPREAAFLRRRHSWRRAKLALMRRRIADSPADSTAPGPWQSKTVTDRPCRARSRLDAGNDASSGAQGPLAARRISAADRDRADATSAGADSGQAPVRLRPIAW